MQQETRWIPVNILPVYRIRIRGSQLVREYQGLQQDGRGGLQPRFQSSIMKKLFNGPKRPELDPVPPVDESKR